MDIFLCRLSKTKSFPQIWRWQFNSCFWIKCSCKFSFRMKLIQLLAVYKLRTIWFPTYISSQFWCCSILYFLFACNYSDVSVLFSALFSIAPDILFCLSSIDCWTSFMESCSNSITTTFSDRSYVCFIFNFLAGIGVKFSRKEFQRYFLGVTELRCLNTCIGQLQWSEENLKALTMENGDRASQQGHHKKIVE